MGKIMEVGLGKVRCIVSGGIINKNKSKVGIIEGENRVKKVFLPTFSHIVFLRSNDADGHFGRIHRLEFS